MYSFSSSYISRTHQKTSHNKGANSLHCFQSRSAVSTVEGGSGASLGQNKAEVYISCIAVLVLSSNVSQTSELELRFVNLGSALISYL